MLQYTILHNISKESPIFLDTVVLILILLKSLIYELFVEYVLITVTLAQYNSTGN